jgi:hypothetical protein
MEGDLAEKAMREQAGSLVVDGHGTFVAGVFEAENAHFAF